MIGNEREKESGGFFGDGGIYFGVAECGVLRMDGRFKKSAVTKSVGSTRFFGEKTVSFDVAQTLEAMKIRDAVLASRNNCGQWIEF